MINRILLVACALTLAGCSRPAPPETSKSDSPADKAIVENIDDAEAVESTALVEPLEGATVLNFRVTGMHCDGCAQGLKSKLVKIDGVLKADASFDESSATVTAKSPAVAAKVLEAIRDSLYEGELIES